VGAHHWRIVGLLDDREFSTPLGEALVAQRGSIEIFVPFESALHSYGITHVVRKAGSFELTRVELDQMLVAVRNRDSVLPVARVIRAVLEKFHDQADYEITVPLELLQQSEATQRVFNVVMLLIAGISLVVGGIGIVNIMLATITERTREIGIRRAVGARRADITAQFLVETVTIALAGGFLGIAVGLGGVQAIVAYTGW
jgi:putative ABC transport system permease protein